MFYYNIDNEVALCLKKLGFDSLADQIRSHDPGKINMFSYVNIIKIECVRKKIIGLIGKDAFKIFDARIRKHFDKKKEV